MAVKEIVQFGDSVLRKKSEYIEAIDDSVLGLIEDLKDTLYSTTGVGLAAPQIGISKRVIFIDLRDGSEPIILINPKIAAIYGKDTSSEGCLSYPGYEGIVKRPKKVTVIGTDKDGNEVEYFGEGLLARAFCHEIDHLDGVLYIDLAKRVYEVE